MVFPDADRKEVRLRVDVSNSSGASREIDLFIEIGEEEGNEIVGTHQKSPLIASGSQSIECIVSIKEPVQSWDEFNPARYRLTARISAAQDDDHQETNLFGFRQIRSQGKSIILNDRRILLRGVVDCAVYPRTGHPPMKVEE